MDHDAVDFGCREHAPQVRHHPRESWQGTERGRFRPNLAARGAEQPTAAGVNEAWFVRLGGKRRQQRVEQVAINRAHVGFEIAGGVDDGIDLRQPVGPRLRQDDIASDRCRAPIREPRR